MKSILLISATTVINESISRTTPIVVDWMLQFENKEDCKEVRLAGDTYAVEFPDNVITLFREHKMLVRAKIAAGVPVVPDNLVYMAEKVLYVTAKLSLSDLLRFIEKKHPNRFIYRINVVPDIRLSNIKNSDSLLFKEMTVPNCKNYAIYRTPDGYIKRVC